MQIANGGNVVQSINLRVRLSLHMLRHRFRIWCLLKRKWCKFGETHPRLVDAIWVFSIDHTVGVFWKQHLAAINKASSEGSSAVASISSSSFCLFQPFGICQSWQMSVMCTICKLSTYRFSGYWSLKHWIYISVNRNKPLKCPTAALCDYLTRGGCRYVIPCIFDSVTKLQNSW